MFLQLPLRFVSGSQSVFTTGDTTPGRAVYLVDDRGTPVPIPDGSTLTYAAFDTFTKQQVISPSAGTILAGVCGLVAYLWAMGDLATPGVYDELWTVTTPDGRQMAFLGTATLQARAGI